jgi:DNA modification methylase
MVDIKLMQGDCLECMKEIPDGSVDMVLTDPPYGTMKGAGLDGWNDGKTDWDSTIETSAMLGQCNRILRTNGALILFSQEPYTSHLITNAHGNIPFSYRMAWLKDHFANALIAKKAPVSYFEDVLVFFKKYDTLAQHPLRSYCIKLKEFTNYNRSRFFKEFGSGKLQHFMEANKESSQFGLCTESAYNELCQRYKIDQQFWFKPYAELEEINRRFKRRFKRRFNLPTGEKYKSNVLRYKKDYDGFHPTQKPVALLADLIETYSNEGDTVLDNCMGSGSTGVACINTNRNFIGIELDEGYFKIAQDRINQAVVTIGL